MNVLFLDTETTGNSEAGDRLVQLAFRVDGGEMINELFKPPVAITFAAMAVHHISEAKVADKPPFAASDTEMALKQLLTTHILVAHNAEYDVGILRNEHLEVPQYICTFKVAHKYLHMDSLGQPLTSRSLQYLRYALDLDEPEVFAHDAAGDVIILEKLFRALVERVKVEIKSEDETEILNHMLGITREPILLRHVRFGKHRGKTWEQVAQEDPSYLTWLSGQSDLDPNLRHTLKHHMQVQQPTQSAQQTLV